METSSLYFELPKELIAQRPAANRSSARLMVVRRFNNRVEHCLVEDLPTLLKPGSVVVVNDTRVIPARLSGELINGAKVPFLLMEQMKDGKSWTAIAPNMTRLKKRAGEVVYFPGGIAAHLLTVPNPKTICLRFQTPIDSQYLELYGGLPLPPYIDRPPDRSDTDQYQTVYATHPGSAAAPTAGLHLTKDLLKELKQSDITVVPITLHIGMGTFTPIRTAYVEDHVIHSERFKISESSATTIEEARRDGRPIVAVGTTVVRTLESAWNGSRITRKPSSTSLFIYPGYQFQIVNQLLTNFHTPRSSLLALVTALAGEHCIRSAYSSAITCRYRFFSYGDAMLIR